MNHQNQLTRRFFMLLVWLVLSVLSGFKVAAAQENAPAEASGTGEVSVTADGTGLVLELGRPAEGESFYSGPSTILYSIPVNGWAFSSSYASTELEVLLEILQGSSVLGSQTTRPATDGAFTFYAMVNPNNLLDPSLQEHDGCFLCHFSTTLALSPGTGALRVTVTDPAGKQVVAERRVITDHSSSAAVPIRVALDSETALPLEGVEVNASTRLYLWRTRHARAAVDAGGTGRLRVETLSQAPTRYVFSVEPQIRSGVLFQGLAPVELTLLPGMTTFPEVTLQVHAETGAIQGQLSPPSGASLPELPVWAFHLPDGEATRARTSPGGAFSFDPLPIGSYLLTADPSALAEAGLVSQASQVDLSVSPQALVDLPLAARDGFSLAGSVRSPAHLPLPFAWVEASQQGLETTVLPDTGQFLLDGLPSGTLTLVASAPGYYSHARVVDPQDPAPVEFSLVPRPQTRTLPWGEGEIVIPPESTVTERRGQLQLDYGWLWGEGSGGEPLTLQAAGSTLRIPEGRFALQALPGATAWFFLFSGQAELLPAGQPPLPILPNQMVALHQGSGMPVDYQPVLLQALQASQPAPSPEPAWQPGLRAVLRDRLAQLGIGVAQAVTIATYSLALLALLIGPLLILVFALKKRKNA